VKIEPHQKHVVVIDRQDFWRGLSEEALRGEGFSVQVLDNYDYPPPGGYAGERPPDLVILGCASIKRDERKLIQRVLEAHQHLLVLCVSLPWPVMRSVFLAGADDVTDKTYDPARLVELVKDALGSLTPRDSYQAQYRKA
jgi:DNA-binding response OmpR family regulator